VGREGFVVGTLLASPIPELPHLLAVISDRFIPNSPTDKSLVREVIEELGNRGQETLPLNLKPSPKLLHWKSVAIVESEQ
jgi:hypothetical protein